MVCHESKCVPEAAEQKGSFCERLESGAAAIQMQEQVQSTT